MYNAEGKSQRIMVILSSYRSPRRLKATGIALFLVLAVMLLARYGITYPMEQAMQPIPSSQEAAHTSPENTAAGGLVDRVISGPDPDEWVAGDIPSHLVNASYDDPELLKHLREHWILPPPDKPRDLEHPEKSHYSQVGQSRLVNDLLKDKTNGFFIELGAADGEKLSNTLFFEKSRNWTGLLIEPNPTTFSVLRNKHRHAYLVNACVSPTGRVSMLNFTMSGLTSGLTDFMEISHKNSIFQRKTVSGFVPVPCFPIGSLLRSIGVSHVDYFSLDVEGPEMDILRSFPFDDVTVAVFTIEFSVKDCADCAVAKLKWIRNLFKHLGNYVEVRTSFGIDAMFLRTTLEHP